MTGAVDQIRRPLTSVRNVTVSPGRIVTKKKGTEFQKLRLRVCLTVEACAELLGVSVRTVQRWDRQDSPLLPKRFLHMYDRQDLSGHGHDWKGWRFSRGKLVSGRLSFIPRNLKQVPHYVDVYNRVEAAKVRLNDGLPVDRCLSIVFASPAFEQIPLLAAPVD